MAEPLGVYKSQLLKIYPPQADLCQVPIYCGTSNDAIPDTGFCLSAVILWKAGIMDMVRILSFVLSRIKHPATSIAMPQVVKSVNDYKLVGFRHSLVGTLPGFSQECNPQEIGFQACMGRRPVITFEGLRIRIMNQCNPL